MGRWELGGPEGGRTLTSAPVSTRKLTPEVRSFTKKRRLLGRPAALVATSGWLAGFPERSRVGGTDVLCLRIFGGTSNMVMVMERKT